MTCRSPCIDTVHYCFWKGFLRTTRSCICCRRVYTDCSPLFPLSSYTAWLGGEDKRGCDWIRTENKRKNFFISLFSVFESDTPTCQRAVDLSVPVLDFDMERNVHLLLPVVSKLHTETYSIVSSQVQTKLLQAKAFIAKKLIFTTIISLQHLVFFCPCLTSTFLKWTNSVSNSKVMSVCRHIDWQTDLKQNL